MEKDGQSPDKDELRPEYEISQLKGGVRGKYADTTPPRTSGSGSVPVSIGVTAIVLLLAALSWITILPGTPRVWAPFNVIVVVPLFLLYGTLGPVNTSTFLAACVVPLFFLIWTYPATWREPKPPLRTLLLSLVMILLSASLLAFGYALGIKYEGRDHVRGVAIISVVCWSAILSLAVIAVRKRNVFWNVTFHVALFAWLAWYAIPYMGELP